LNWVCQWLQFCVGLKYEMVKINLLVRVESCLNTLYKIQYEHGSEIKVSIGNGNILTVSDAIEKVEQRKQELHETYIRDWSVNQHNTNRIDNFSE